MALVLLLIILWFSFTNKKTNDELISDIQERMDELKSDIQELKDELKSDIQEIKYGLKSDIQKMRDELKSDIQEIKDELKSDIQEIKDELKSDIQEIKYGLKSDIQKMRDELSSQLNMSLDILLHNYRIEKLIYCSGLIEINLGSKQGNHYARGIFIRIGYQFFFVTCLHAVYDSNSLTIRTINKIRLTNGYFLYFEEYVIIFNDVKYPDIALIPIKRNESYESFAVYVYHDENFIGQSLFYIIKREGDYIFDECNVVEKPYASHIIKINCSGTQGSSETGFVNEYGHLVAIHKGQNSFLDLSDIKYYFDQDEEEVYDPYLDIKDDLIQSSKMIFGNINIETIKKVNKSHLTPYPIKKLAEIPNENFINMLYNCFSSVYNYFDSAKKFLSRNSRSKAISSKYIYDLFNNRTENVIILKQGQFHIFNAAASIKMEFSLFLMKHYALSLLIIFLSIY